MALLYILLKSLNALLLQSVGFRNFLVNHFDRERDDTSRPGVTHGSFFMYFLFILFFCKGKALSNAILYLSMKHLYAKLGQFILSTSRKSIDSRLFFEVINVIICIKSRVSRCCGISYLFAFGTMKNTEVVGYVRYDYNTHNTIQLHRHTQRKTDRQPQYKTVS